MSGLKGRHLYLQDALSQSLASQWEYPHDARAPAKHTRLRFVKWAQNLPANPLASSERKPGPRP